MEALYRHYDENDTLLYIGVSLNAVARLAQHRDHSGWFPNIRRVTVEPFENRKAALRAETRAIAKERPKFNINKVPKARPQFEGAQKTTDIRTRMYDGALTIPQFCWSMGNIRESFYHKLQKQGIGPRETLIGDVTVITDEDAAEWLRGLPTVPRRDGGQL